VREFFTSATIAALVDLPFALFFVLVIAFIGGPLALVVLTIMVFIVAASYVLQVALKKDILKAMRAGEERHGVLVETINGLETVKAIGADQRLRSLYTEHLGEMARYGQEARYYSNLGISLTYFMQQMMTVLIVVFGMYLIKDNALSVGALIAAVLLAGRAVAPMAQIASLMTRFYQTRNALNMITALMHKDVERPQNKAFIHRPALQGEVAFKNVSFAYPRSERKILDNVSFSIRHGEKVAIIGRIGSGKSTLARLLMGLYQPAEGQILVNDTDQAQIDPADLRRNFAYIAQDVTLFRGTVRDNITAARIEASDEEILRAAQISGVHEFVKAHPLGLDAEVGEGGSALSGGQRQAVALARAMLTKPSLYICDEPTNAMDVQAENAFVQHIKGEVNNKTLILITHRLSLLEIVDRIIVVEQGKIIMDGPKKDVIKSLSGEGDS
ncbi:MAG: ATP-binding cassette domain-containing protein, partial [Pseudomonadota bacterium]|nr:ATP-binding cassette domain-containing protein [Pseudomonadota bacterium]